MRHVFRRLVLSLTAAVAACAIAAPVAAAGNKAYVAYGDSYSSGPGFSDSDNSWTCMQSSQNYPSIVAAHYGLGAKNSGNWGDYSCAGAKFADLATQVNNSHTGSPTPLGPDTKVVTFTIGGNEPIGPSGKSVYDAITTCADPAVDCTAPSVAATLPTAADITALDRYGRNAFDRGLSSAVLNIENWTWTGSGHAKVEIISYPQLVGSGGCTDTLNSPGKWGYLPAEAVYIHNLEFAVKNAQAATAAYFSSLGGDVVAVDALTPTTAAAGVTDKGMCASSGAWINQPAWYAGAYFPSNFANRSNHPTATGMTGLANLAIAASGM